MVGGPKKDPWRRPFGRWAGERLPAEKQGGVALSDKAQVLLATLDIGGRAANPAAVQRRLNWSEEEFRPAAEELCRAGLADMVGKRLARVVSAGGVSPEAEMLLAALPADGSPVGGLRLRSSLDLDNETYGRARGELDAAGLVIRGRGRGGSIARASAKAEQTPTSRRRLVAKESDLYDPFVEWLSAELAGQPGFAHAKKTASAKGWASGSGKWSRPDATAVQVTTYEWLAEVTVEVYSYEIKRAGDAQKLESVYEAAAHGRWAHRASLVVELNPDAGALPDALLDEIRRFRLGLYLMRRRDDDSFDIREDIKPPSTHDAQPENVNDLINTFLGRDIELRNEYRRWIGR